MAPSAPPMAPTATPRAATVPTSIFFGGGGALSALTVVSAVEASLVEDSASAAAARFATCSSITRMNFLYGDQNACRMLIGLSTMWVITASQSRPCRS